MKTEPQLYVSSDRLVAQRQVLKCFFKSFYVCVCVWGGGGGGCPVTSFTFRNSKRVQHMLSRGGGGVKLFTKGVESNC